jgi:hypothetical protein
MRKLISYISITVYLTACNNSDSVTNSKYSTSLDSIDSANSRLRTDSNKIPEDTLLLDVGCYYKLDDKYSESKDTAEINNWWRKKLTGFERNGFQNNLFAGKGGGPNGAEWNSSTDLYVVATLNKILKDETIELELNKEKVSEIQFLKYIPKNKIGEIIYCVLPKIVWEKYLRKINANDLEGIYGKENIEALKRNSAVPLETGKVVEITINIKNSKTCLFSRTAFFHVAYGE